jgi:hypothetical protein
LNVLQRLNVVVGYLQAIFQVPEDTSKLFWAGVKLDAFCLKDCACSHIAWLDLQDYA